MHGNPNHKLQNMNYGVGPTWDGAQLNWCLVFFHCRCFFNFSCGIYCWLSVILMFSPSDRVKDGFF